MSNIPPISKVILHVIRYDGSEMKLGINLSVERATDRRERLVDGLCGTLRYIVDSSDYNESFKWSVPDKT